MSLLTISVNENNELKEGEAKVSFSGNMSLMLYRSIRCRSLP